MTPPKQDVAGAAAPSFPIARLPIELRDMVYKAYLEQQSLIEVDIDGDEPVVKSDINDLQRTCHHVDDRCKELMKQSKLTATVRFDIGTPAKVSRYGFARTDPLLRNIALVLFGYRGRICGYRIQAVEFHLGTVDVDNVDQYLQGSLGSAMDLVVEASSVARLELQIPCKLLCDMAPIPGESVTVELATQTEEHSWILVPMPKDGPCKAAFALVGRFMYDAWKAGLLGGEEYSARLSVLQKMRSKLGQDCVEQLRFHNARSPFEA